MKKDTCCDEIGLCAQNIDTILRSIVNTFEVGGGLFDHLRSQSIFSLTSFKVLGLCSDFDILKMTIFVICNC